MRPARLLLSLPARSRRLLHVSSHPIISCPVNSSPAWFRLSATVSAGLCLASSALLCDKKAGMFETAALDEAHEFPKANPPLAAYERASKLALVYDDDVEIMWRFARAAYNLAEDPSTAPADKKMYMTEALKLIQAAEAIDNSNSDCHRWHGIILSGYGQYQSSKEFIGNTFVMADHWKQAVTLNPTDASAHHLLGRWSFDVAGMAWWKRKASTLFAEPPSATYEEALASFERAESISPGFWKMNSVMLGHAHAKIGNKDKAAHYYQAALRLPVKTEEDSKAQQQALKGLSDLGIKTTK